MPIHMTSVSRSCVTLDYYMWPSHIFFILCSVILSNILQKLLHLKTFIFSHLFFLVSFYVTFTIFVFFQDFFSWLCPCLSLCTKILRYTTTYLAIYAILMSLFSRNWPVCQTNFTNSTLNWLKWMYMVKKYRVRKK